MSALAPLWGVGEGGACAIRLWASMLPTCAQAYDKTKMGSCQKVVVIDSFLPMIAIWAMCTPKGNINEHKKQRTLFNEHDVIPR